MPLSCGMRLEVGKVVLRSRTIHTVIDNRYAVELDIIDRFDHSSLRENPAFLRRRPLYRTSAWSLQS